jgi:uncharacterized protein (TIGR02145 family)
MYKLLLTTAAVAAAIGLAVAGEPSFGTFTDIRDGQTYKTVKIGRQTWMAQNLNYQPQTGKSWCYKNDTSYCNKYGRLYAWNTARKACPAGYHLPSEKEWIILAKITGRDTSQYGMICPHEKGCLAGKRLKAKSGWRYNSDDKMSGNGTDNYGFSALPGGRWDADGGFENADPRKGSIFGGIGAVGYWWTATLNDLDDYGVTYFGLCYAYNHVDMYLTGKYDGLSVRCVADHP